MKFEISLITLLIFGLIVSGIGYYIGYDAAFKECSTDVQIEKVVENENHF